MNKRSAKKPDDSNQIHFNAVSRLTNAADWLSLDKLTTALTHKLSSEKYSLTELVIFACFVE